jgi:hypothetical protein
MLSIRNKLISVTTAGFAMFLVAFAVAAQPGTTAPQNPQPSWAGKYEGMVGDDKDGKQKVTLDLMEDAGKYSGTLTTGKGSFKILKGQVANETLTLDIEKPGGTSGPMALKKSAGGLVTTFMDGGKSVTIDFRKAVADEISGEWEAVADAQGQAVPFTLVLKLDGEKVTGSSSSQLGSSTVSSGTWKDGKLAVVLDTGGGNITLVATMVEGKLSGEYDYMGQGSGKWVAQKKK